MKQSIHNCEGTKPSYIRVFYTKDSGWIVDYGKYVGEIEFGIEKCPFCEKKLFPRVKQKESPTPPNLRKVECCATCKRFRKETYEDFGWCSRYKYHPKWRDSYNKNSTAWWEMPEVEYYNICDNYERKDDL